MKKKAVLIAAAIITVIIIIGGFMMLGKTRGKKETITAFESVRLTESTMRGTTEYEIILSGETAEISLYRFYYGNGKEERRPEKSVKCETKAVIGILNECGISSWNGFSGAHPKGVNDGTMFRFEASVNGGKTVKADGSANFPRNYRLLTDWLAERMRSENSQQ